MKNQLPLIAIDLHKALKATQNSSQLILTHSVSSHHYHFVALLCHSNDKVIVVVNCELLFNPYYLD